MEMEKKNKNPNANANPNPLMDCPEDFRCPISMELMEDPVTISTGVTYERKNIERWFLTYKKPTCPATMVTLENYDITPNHTLKRLILSWQNGHSRPPSSSPSTSSSPPPDETARHEEMKVLLETVGSMPFKVSSLKKLRSIVGSGEEAIMADFRRSGGVEVVVGIIVGVLEESADFTAFRACEEALGVLHHLKFPEEDDTIKLLSNPDCVKSISIVLQRGSADARYHAISVFQKITKSENCDLSSSFIKQQGIDFFKSLLELVSDEICTKASSCALKVLIEILGKSKKSRLKAIEAGAIFTLIELLPDSDRSKCEKILHLIKLLCESAEGRSAFIEHGLGIAAVSKKMLHVSSVATKIAVKVLWLVCNFHPNERVIEEMMIYGAVKKLVAVLYVDGGGGGGRLKEKVVNILKVHGRSWRRYPCFPSELRDYLGLLHDSC